jgi:hypothetical protein
MQHQPVRIDTAFDTDPLNQRGRSLGDLVIVDLPAHNAPAPYVHDEVETKKPPADVRLPTIRNQQVVGSSPTAGSRNS